MRSLAWPYRLVAIALALFSTVACAQPITPPANPIAHYTTPVQRYGHFALGPPHEYASLVVKTDAGQRLKLDLPEDEVFEDLVPRPVQMQAGSATEWLTVVSQRDRGARLVLVGLRHGQLQITAQSTPIGQAFRWLNPVGAIDLDGDGITEIVAVVTPHLAGVLTVYQQVGAQLVARATLRGLSNHRFGSAELGMATFVPIASGTTVVVPSLDHQSLVLVRYARNALHATGRCAMPAAVVGAVQWSATAGLTAMLSTGLHAIDLKSCAR
ncbi:MAG: hypothetical protein U5M53_10355 [Rhodoferax sp.]|nr:hypothetical protein [Rhodoferax sp.]